MGPKQNQKCKRGSEQLQVAETAISQIWFYSIRSVSLEQLLRFWGELGSEGSHGRSFLCFSVLRESAFRTHAALRHGCSVAMMMLTQGCSRRQVRQPMEHLKILNA